MEVKKYTSGIVNVSFGENVKIVEPLNLYGCTIGSNCFIGPFVEIQEGAIGCFIGHGVMFVNDKFSKGGPARGDRSLYGSTTIGNNVSIGSNATILPVKICDGVVIGAGAVVTKDILEQGTYIGNPAQKLK